MNISTIEIALKMGCEVRLTKEQSKQLYEHIEQLQSQLREHERLHSELAAALRHDAEAPSLCDLVAVARAVVNEKDELAAHLERLTKSILDFNNKNHDLNMLLSAAHNRPTTSLAERDAGVIAKFADHLASKFQNGMSSGDVYAEAERIKRGEP